MHEKKLITILTGVYNKAPYLETWAISVAAQTYLDKARVIVIEDASTDGSLDLLKEYVSKYNIPIELIVHEKNMGFLSTLLESYALIETKYFTILDADDYWLSPQKLEKAINFLEAHEDFVGYATNVFCEYENGKMTQGISDRLPSQVVIHYLQGAPLPQTSAVVFRNFFTPDFLKLTVEAAEKYPCGAAGGDSFRNFFALRFGKIYFENSFDVVYRADIGEWGSLSDIEHKIIPLTENIEFFAIYSENFGIDDNAKYKFREAANWYAETLVIFKRMMGDTLSIANFRAGKYTKQVLGRYSPNSDGGFDIIFDTLLSHAKFFTDMGLRIKC